MTIIDFPTGQRLRDHESVIVGDLIEFAAVGDLDGYSGGLDDVFDIEVSARIASSVLDSATVQALSVSRSLVTARVKTIEMMAGALCNNSVLDLDTDTMLRLLSARVAWATDEPPTFDPVMSPWRRLDHCVAATAAILDAYVPMRGDVAAQRAAAAFDLNDLGYPEDPFADDLFEPAPAPSVGAHIWAMVRIAAQRASGVVEHRQSYELAHRLLCVEARRRLVDGIGFGDVLAHPSWTERPTLWRPARIVLFDAAFPGGVGDTGKISAADRTAAVIALLGCALATAPLELVRSQIDELTGEVSAEPQVLAS